MRPVHGIVPFDLARRDDRARPRGLPRPWPGSRRQPGGRTGPERRLRQRRARRGADVRRRAACRRWATKRCSACLRPLGERALDGRVRARRRPLGVPRPARVHTYSATLCWAACDRLAQIAQAARPRRAGEVLARPSAIDLREKILARGLGRAARARSPAPSASRRSTRACCSSPNSGSCSRTIRVSSRPARRSAAT